MNMKKKQFIIEKSDYWNFRFSIFRFMGTNVLNYKK